MGCLGTEIISFLPPPYTIFPCKYPESNCQQATASSGLLAASPFINIDSFPVLYNLLLKNTAHKLLMN